VTKVMTMLLIMEALDAGRIKKEDMVSTSAYAASMGGSQVFLEEGEQMSVHDLLKCIAVSSANDAAVAMAEHLSGSEAAFVEKMNTRAAELGMKDTHFSNCTGLPVADHYTSAYDIALMSRQLILHHPDIQTYSTIWMDTIRGGAFGLSNTNRLIRFYNGATGLKTGFTDSALYCLSATAERNGMELIAAVMKAPTSDDRFQAAKTLMDYGFANFALYDSTKGQTLSPVPVRLGSTESVPAVFSGNPKVLVEKSQLSNVTHSITLAEEVHAPVEAGQTLGELTVTSGDEVLATVPILAQCGVERVGIGTIFWRMLKTYFLY